MHPLIIDDALKKVLQQGEASVVCFADAARQHELEFARVDAPRYDFHRPARRSGDFMQECASFPWPSQGVEETEAEELPSDALRRSQRNE